MIRHHASLNALTQCEVSTHWVSWLWVLWYTYKNLIVFKIKVTKSWIWNCKTATLNDNVSFTIVPITVKFIHGLTIKFRINKIWIQWSNDVMMDVYHEDLVLVQCLIDTDSLYLHSYVYWSSAIEPLCRFEKKAECGESFLWICSSSRRPQSDSLKSIFKCCCKVFLVAFTNNIHLFSLNCCLKLLKFKIQPFAVLQ